MTISRKSQAFKSLSMRQHCILLPMRLILKALLSALIVIMPCVATAQVYSGPKCFGPFCANRKFAATNLFKQLGAPLGSSFPYSYRSKDRRTFLIIRGDMPDDVSYISLRDFPAWGGWEDKDEKLTDEIIRNWKTPERIGLGNTEEDVLKAYGKPSGEEEIEADDKRASMGEKKLIYKGRIGGVAVTAGFGIRGGKVSLVELDRSEYSGPDCVGLFCIDMDVHVPLNGLQRKLGRPARASGQTDFYCYQADDKRTFLSVQTGDDVEIHGAFLSDFPNCIHTTPVVSPSDLHGWKTPEGIGLGSSKDDVLKAYGKPSKVEAVNSRTCCGDFFQTYAKGDKRPNIGSEKLLYHGDETHELSRSEFGLREGRVSYILLSDSE